MPLSAIDVISPAFERMKKHLFKPFRFGQWVRLAVVGFLAGEMGSGGGCSGRFPFNSSTRGSQQFQGTAFPGGRETLFFFGIALAVVLVCILAIALLYIGSRMRFVLFDSVIAGRCSIREFWSQRRELGFRYFVWQLLFGIAAILSVILLLGIPLAFAFRVGWLNTPGEHIFPLVLGGTILVLVFLSTIVSLFLVQVLVKDFVVPQMVFDNVSVGDGWRRLWAMMKQEKGSFAGYIGMKFILALAAAVFLGIVLIIILLVLLIPVGGLGAITVLGGRAAGLTWNPLTVAIAIVCGGIVLIAIIMIAALVSVPSIVFFPAYSIHFFAERYPALRAVVYPLSSPPDLDSPSPQVE